MTAMLAVVSCGKTQPEETFVPPVELDGALCSIEGTERFFPLAEGNIWTYQITRLKSGEVEEKTHTVGALADIGGEKAGIMAYPITSAKLTGDTITWQEDTGIAVVRHLEQDRAGETHNDEYYNPSKLRFDESPGRLDEGVTFTNNHVEKKTNLSTGETTIKNRSEKWIVVRSGEEITVPAGTFCTVRLRRVVTVDGEEGSDKQYWFARGVGKVKERSDSRREELSDFSVEIDVNRLVDAGVSDGGTH